MISSRIARLVAFALLTGPAAAQPVPPAAVASKTPAPCGPTGPVRDGHPDEEDEPACLAALGPLAKRDGATLTLSLANGKTKAFTNEGGKPAWGVHGKTTSWTKSFWLVAYDPAAPAFVVRASDRGLVGIDARDGHETTFGEDFPRFAPGGAFALTIADEGTGAVTIRDISASPAKIVWETKPKHPKNRKFIAWDGDRRARLLVEDEAIAFLVRDASGKWTYDTVPMDEPEVEAPPTCMPDPTIKDQKLDACLAKLDGMVIDNGTLLSLQLEDGSRKRLLGDKSGGWSNYELYGLVGFDPRIHLYVVKMYYYEGSGGMKLVDSRTGEETDLDDGSDVPVVSPDGKLLLVTSSGDHENNAAGTDVKIFAREPKPKEIWSHEISDQPDGIDHVLGWDGNSRFSLQLADSRKATVSRDDKGAWQYEAIGTPKPKPANQP